MGGWCPSPEQQLNNKLYATAGDLNMLYTLLLRRLQALHPTLYRTRDMKMIFLASNG